MLPEMEEIPNDWPFVKQLRQAAKQDLDFWQRPDKPNLPVANFHAFLAALPEGFLCRWKPRESSMGRKGEEGEDLVFVFRVQVNLMGVNMRFYCKGYFFSRERKTGVCIQSFRKDS